ncbi:MAG: hypothetical protein JJ916_03775 [Phycisphaerales bacterium]|nr:hypothetical protein [Phycisphaerales bacterium]
MAISHTCPSCCRELGNIRAVPDPHYGLGVIVCPGCETAVVRTRHPDLLFWKHVRGVRKSLQRLILGLIFTALAVGATIGMAFWMMPEITDRSGRYQMPDLARPEVPFQIGIAILITTMCGCIARTIYAHQKFPLILGMFLVLIGVFLNIDWLISRLMIHVNDLARADVDIRIASHSEIKRRLLACLALLLPFLAGMGIGVIFNRIIDRTSSNRVVRIRRRIRKRRSRLD